MNCCSLLTNNTLASPHSYSLCKIVTPTLSHKLTGMSRSTAMALSLARQTGQPTPALQSHTLGPATDSST